MYLPACDEEESFDFGVKPTGDFTFEVDPENTLLVSFTPDNVDTANVLLAWDFGTIDGFALRSIEYNPVLQFANGGTFTITMVLTNDAGITAIKKDITLTEPEVPVIPQDFLILAGDKPQGKTWMVDMASDGHSGAGNGSSQTPNIWERPANSLACLGLYNDVYTFRLENNEFVLHTGGDIYTRGGFEDQYSNPVNQSDICDPGLGLSGNDFKADYTSPGNLTWNIETRTSDGVKVLKVSDGGYLGMGVGATEYELLVFEEDEIYLRFLQGGGSVSWYLRLIPVPDQAVLLSGGLPEGKTWVIDKDTDGHSGAGNGDQPTPNIWERSANALACLGLYNDEYTFKLDGMTFDLNTGGDIYTRGGFESQFTNPVNQSTVCDAGLGLSGNDFIAEYTSPGGLTWSVETREDEVMVIKVSDGGYIGMGVNAVEYEIEILNEDELYVRFLQEGGAVAWYKRLVPKDE